ncbi:MAG: hypothetical protein GF341_12545 [candidate division Zixibacteria bacterium]|nr:hypothetical protein [candidate division Zixibacteria bacterium]
MRLDHFHPRTIAVSFVAVICIALCMSVVRARTSGTGSQGIQTDPSGVATIVPSDVDTLRVLNQITSIGDTFAIDLHVANVDTIGAYAIRLRYDPAAIEPLTDTVPDAGDTIYALELDQLRGTAFEEFAGSVNEPGVMTMLAADFDLDTNEALAPGSGGSARIMWRVQATADTQTTPIAFEVHPDFPETFNAISDFYGAELIRPILKDGSIRILPGPCDCPHQADLDTSGVIDAVDLNLLIYAIFFNGADPVDPSCPTSRGDWNCDGVLDASDLNLLIRGIFFVPSPPCNPCE